MKLRYVLSTTFASIASTTILILGSYSFYFFVPALIFIALAERHSPSNSRSSLSSAL
jgi:hypothetical protein